MAYKGTAFVAVSSNHLSTEASGVYKWIHNRVAVLNVGISVEQRSNATGNTVENGAVTYG